MKEPIRLEEGGMFLIKAVFEADPEAKYIYNDLVKMVHEISFGSQQPYFNVVRKMVTEAIKNGEVEVADGRIVNHLFARVNV